jgi:hypothetical protein
MEPGRVPDHSGNDTIEPPARRVTDLDRQRAADMLQQACGSGQLTLAEFTDRVGAVWAAETVEELERALGTLGPLQPAPVSLARTTEVGLFGDIQRVGNWLLPRRMRTIRLFASSTIDLRSATPSAEVVADQAMDIIDVSVFNNLTVIVPAGVDVVMGGFSVFGRRRLKLAPTATPRRAIRVRVRAYSIFGEVTVISRP